MADEGVIVHEYYSAPIGGQLLTICAPVGDDIGERIARRKLPYEWEALSISDRMVRRLGDVIDVGANIGNHSLFWACESGARVAAFEPPGYALELLQKNLRLNKADGQVCIYPVAAGEKSGVGILHRVDGNLGASYLEVLDSSVGDVSDSIPVEPIDDFSFRGVGLIKVDVEGDELSVLVGARETLRREQPAVWVEVLNAEARRNVRIELRAVGYRVPPIWLSDTNAFFCPTWADAAFMIACPRSAWLLLRRSIGRHYRSLRRALARR